MSRLNSLHLGLCEALAVLDSLGRCALPDILCEKDVALVDEGELPVKSLGLSSPGEWDPEDDAEAAGERGGAASSKISPVLRTYSIS